MAHYFGIAMLFLKTLDYLQQSSGRSQMLQLLNHRDGHFISELTFSISEIKRGKTAKTPGDHGHL